MGSEGDGRIPAGWEEKPLIDCTSDRIISYGIVQPGSHVDNGIPIVRVNNFSGGNLDLSSPLKVDPQIEKSFIRTRLNGGEVLLTLVGSTGQSVIAPSNLKGWNVARAIAVIRPHEDIGAKWIDIVLKSKATASFLDAHANTTVQKTLNLKDVKRLPVLIPPKKIKDFIETCVSSLDEKIELNRQMNTTLEAMAQALFKSWFVDFDPVIDNARAAGNEIPEELAARAERRAKAAQQPSPEYPHTLPAAIRQQFPDRFVFTETMGWMPEGWELGNLSRLAKLVNKSVQPNSEPRKLWTHFSIPAFDAGLGPAMDLGQTIKSGKYRVPIGSVLVSKLNPQTPRVWLPTVSMESAAICSTEFMPFVPLNFDERTFLYSLFRSDNIQSEINQRVSGSTGSRQRVSPKDIAVLPTLIPPRGPRLVFSSLLDPIFTKQQENNQQINELAAVRDTLLPKLLSGQLRIPEAEQLLAEVN